MATIHSLITDTLGLGAKKTIVQELWAKDSAVQVEAYQPYFCYYETECRRLRLGISKEVWQSSTMAATTHEDILHIVRTLSLERDARRPDVRALLRLKFPNAQDLAINRSIDFALRVWLMLNV